MKSDSIFQTQRTWGQRLSVALALVLLAALLLPLAAMADHDPVHPSQFDLEGSETEALTLRSTRANVAASCDIEGSRRVEFLLEDSEQCDVYRQLVASFLTGELVYHKPGR